MQIKQLVEVIVKKETIIELNKEENEKLKKLKRNEALRINSGTAVTAGVVTSVSNDKATIDLRRPITAEQKSRLSISRRLGDRWRLIGAGVIS